jgi:hypothetical protein
MRVTITDDGFTVEGAEDLGIPGISAADREKLEFLQAFAFAMARLAEEMGMVAAQPDAKQAIETMKGKAC